MKCFRMILSITAEGFDDQAKDCDPVEEANGVMLQTAVVKAVEAALNGFGTVTPGFEYVALELVEIDGVEETPV